jgi:hypothetical protein
MQMLTMSQVVHGQIVYGCHSLGSFTSAERATFVEYGFARHRNGINDTVLDEPLAILAALHWLNERPPFSLVECLRHDIGKHSNRKNSFESYLTFYLRKIFETAPTLDAVFTFRDDFARRGSTDLAWQHEKFELVTVTATADRNNPLVSVVTPTSGPSSNIGFLAESGDDVLQWISANSNQIAFCFPPEHCGPDILCFVRSLVSKRLLLLVIQAKQYETIENPILIHGVRTITPSWFWKSKDPKVCLKKMDLLQLTESFFDYSTQQLPPHHSYKTIILHSL